MQGEKRREQNYVKRKIVKRKGRKRREKRMLQKWEQRGVGKIKRLREHKREEMAYKEYLCDRVEKLRNKK